MAEKHEQKEAAPSDYNAALSKNIIQLMNNNNVSESDLARALSLPYNTIHRLISGHTTDPRISTLKSIASYFNVSLDNLITNEAGNEEALARSPGLVPIITWEQISNLDFLPTINKSNWDNWLHLSIGAVNDLSPHTYAIESRPSMQPRFPVGTFFVIDPECKPIDGDLVLVKIDNNAVSLRELVIDPPSMKLLPIVENSDAISFDKTSHEIIGVIVLFMHHSRRV